MNSISSPSFRVPLPLSERLQKATNVDPSQPQSFGDLLQAGVMNVNGNQQHASAQVHELVTGGDVSQVEVFTAVQKADMSFRLLVQVRNKLMSAYDEINAIRI